MKKYYVCLFPSLYGTPMKTNFLVIAYLLAFYRCVFQSGIVEIYKMKDGKTDGRIFEY